MESASPTITPKFGGWHIGPEWMSIPVSPALSAAAWPPAPYDRGALPERILGLFTLPERGLSDGQPVERSRLVGSISRALVADSDWDALQAVAALLHPGAACPRAEGIPALSPAGSSPSRNSISTHSPQCSCMYHYYTLQSVYLCYISICNGSHWPIMAVLRRFLR